MSWLSGQFRSVEIRARGCLTEPIKEIAESARKGPQIRLAKHAAYRTAADAGENCLT